MVKTRKTLTRSKSQGTRIAPPIARSTCAARTTPSEREHYLQINAPVCRLRVEYATGQCCRLAKQARAEISNRRTWVDLVEYVARIGAEGEGIALIGSFRAAKRTATRTTTHDRAATASPSTFATRTRTAG